MKLFISLGIILCWISTNCIYSQTNLSEEYIKRGIEYCEQNMYQIGLYSLNAGLNSSEELSDSIKNIGEMYRQCAYILTNDTSHISIELLEKLIPLMKHPCGINLVIGNKYLSDWYTNQQDYKKAYTYIKRTLEEIETLGEKKNIMYLACIAIAADLQDILGNYDEAAKFYQYLYYNAKNINTKLYINALGGLATYFYLYNIDYCKSLSYSKEQANATLELYGKSSKEYILALQNVYDACLNIPTEHDLAISTAYEIYNLQKESNINKEGYIAALENLITAYNINRSFSLATPYVQELVAITKGTSKWKEVASTLSHLYFMYGNSNEAINLQRKIISLYKKEKKIECYQYIYEISNLIHYLSNREYTQNEIRELYDIINTTVINDIDRLPDSMKITYCLIKAEAYKETEQYWEYYKCIKHLKNKINEEYIYFFPIETIQECFFSNSEEAFNYIKTKKDKFEKTNNTYNQNYLSILDNIANLYSETNLPSKAIETRTKAATVKKAIYGSNSINYIEELAMLSSLYLSIMNLQQYSMIEDSVLTILKRNENMNERYIQELISHWGVLANVDPQRALREHLNIYNDSKKQNHIPYNLFYCIANDYTLLNDYKNAIKWIDKKLAIPCSSPDSIITLCGKAKILGMCHEITNSIKCYELAYSISQRIRMKESEKENILQSLSAVYCMNKEYSKAQTILTNIIHNNWNRDIKALQLLPEYEQNNFWQYHNIYRYLPNYINQKEDSSNFDFKNLVYNYILRIKGIILNIYRSKKDYILNSKDYDLKESYQAFLFLRKKIDKLSKVDQEQLLNLENRLLSNFKFDCDTINVSMLKNRLGDGDLAIEFINYNTFSKDSTKYAALLLKKNWDTPIFIQLDIQQHNHYHMDDIYNKIWNPLEKYATTNCHIYFSPSGMLHQIPIESLPVGNGKIMSDIYHMHRLSSTRELALKKDPIKYKKAALYGGLNYDMTDSDMKNESSKYQKEDNTDILSASRGLLEDSIRGHKWIQLGNTRKEVEYIKELLEKSHITANIFKGNSGNEESFKALSGQEYNIIHLATHGFFYPNEVAKKKDYFKPILMQDELNISPTDMSLWRSGLVLSGGNRAWKGDSIPEEVEDGILKSQEIKDLDLRGADLVVLSACHTGQGEVTDEGVFGLQRAFKMAGVQTIVMSLTEADDQTTMAMMNKFYTNLLSGQSKHDAFYNAQRYIRSIKPDPIYWAGWIMLD